MDDLVTELEVGSYYRTHCVSGFWLYYKVLRRTVNEHEVVIKDDTGEVDTVDERYMKAHPINKLTGIIKVGE